MTGMLCSYLQRTSLDVSDLPAAHERDDDALSALDQALAARLRKAREDRELTQQALSTRSKWADPEQKGISRTAIIAYEAGSSRPGAREIRLLCETLKITPNFLLFGREEPHEVTHAAREGFKAKASFADAFRVALALMALKGHERDAVLSLVLSLAGRQLGDARLSGLSALGSSIAIEFEAMLEKSYPELYAKGSASLEAIADELSRGVSSNLGHRLSTNEDGDVTGGSWLYPDPGGS